MHQQEQSETNLIAVLICPHLQILFFYSHDTCGYLYCVCPCMCWDSEVGTFKSCLGYCCLSSSEENKGPTMDLLALMRSRMLIRPSWAKRLYRTFKSLKVLWCSIGLRHLNWPWEERQTKHHGTPWTASASRVKLQKLMTLQLLCVSQAWQCVWLKTVFKRRSLKSSTLSETTWIWKTNKQTKEMNVAADRGKKKSTILCLETTHPVWP